MAQVSFPLFQNEHREKLNRDLVGTAAVVCPVEKIGYLEHTINIPTGENGLGPITQTMLDEITGRQMGKIESDWSVFVTQTK